MVEAANAKLNTRSIRQLESTAVNLLLQVGRFNDGSHRVTQIAEVVGLEGEALTLQDVFLFETTEVGEDGKVRGIFRACDMSSKLYNRIKACGVHLPRDARRQ